MRDQIEGSRAIAEIVARCRPAVVPAYPITPQTHIVEAVGAMIKAGELGGCEYVTVESEFAAMSAAIGASAMGARTYTATASQGLLYMTEAVFNAAGLGLPVVMTVANRAIGAPINIWNDHSDAMSQRDCGWVQLYAADNQHAVDLHALAFRLAENISTPVMVCVDGFVLTHAVEPVDVPEQALVDRFLPPFTPRQVLDPDQPVTIGAMVGPEAFTEVRWLANHALGQALPAFRDHAAAWASVTGRAWSPTKRHGPPSAGTVVVALGSVIGTLLDAVGVDGAAYAHDVAVLDLTMFRPFPAADVRAALREAHRVIVLERAFAPGSGGIVSADVRAALNDSSVIVNTVVAGLGGRPVTVDSLRRMLAHAADGALPDLSFLDLDDAVVGVELGRRNPAAAGRSA